MDEGIIHCGHRRKGPPRDKSWDGNVYFNDIHHFNGELLSEIIDDIDLNRVKVGEDSNLMLEYLTRGYRNRRSDEFVYESHSWYDGGCSNYRDSELHDKEHKKLQDYWGKDLVYLKKRGKAVGKYGDNIGVINDYGYRTKLAFKKSQK